MSAVKKTTRPPKEKKVASVSKEEVADAEIVPKRTLTQKARAPFTHFWRWRTGLQPRSPHQSFRWTRRRDYERSLELPGYIAFTVYVWRYLWRHRDTFVWMILIYTVLSAVLVGVASQTTYTQLGDLLRTTSSNIFQGDIGQVGEAGLLFAAAMSGAINPNLTESQQFIAGILALLMWLTTIWLLRAYKAGSKPTFRDGLYNAGAPIIPTVLISLVLLLQLIPVAIAAIGISAALPTGFVSQGIEAMLFWAVILLLGLLSLYWVTSTLFALVLVTLPGVYPLSALKTANELVVGRRPRIVLRVVWLLCMTSVFWALIMIPIILLDAWLKDIFPAIQWVPIVPVMLLIISASTVVWIAGYIYLLYRKVVDDNAAPA